MNNEELHTIYASLNITIVSKARGMRWTGHVACMEEMKN